MPEENNDNGQANQAGQEGSKPLFGGIDAQGKERLFTNGEDAGKSWQASQDYIKNLEQQVKDSQATIDTLKAQTGNVDVSEKIDQALALLQAKENQMQQPTGDNQAVDVEALKAELLKQAQETAISSVSGMKQREIAETNQAVSIQAAKDYYGSEYENKLREVGAGLGLNDDAIKQMAQANPALFKQTFGLTGQKPTGINPDGSVSTGLFNGQAPDIKQVNKHWGHSSKVEALEHNMATVDKMLKDSGGNVQAVAEALGIKNFNPSGS